MSIQAINWVLDTSRTQSGERLVLIALASHAPKEQPWIAWPSVPTIAKKAGVGERRVRYALRQMERDGRLRQLPEPADRYGTKQYEIRTDALADEPDDARNPEPEVEPEPVEAEPVEPEPEPASGGVETTPEPRHPFHSIYDDSGNLKC